MSAQLYIRVYVNYFLNLRVRAYLCGMKYTDYQTGEKSFRSLTGLSHEQFFTLLPCFEEAHDRYLTQRYGR
jgi:hypothetical protein